MTDDLDAFAEAKEGEETGQNQINYIVKLAHEASVVSDSVAQLSEALKEAESRQRELLEKKIPEAMDEIQMTEFKLPDGTKLAIGDKMYGSLPKDPNERQIAIDLIREYDGSAIIDSKVYVEVDKEEQEEIKRLFDAIDACGYDAEEITAVHASTLKRFAKDRLEAGEPVDLKALGLWQRRVTKITLPK